MAPSTAPWINENMNPGGPNAPFVIESLQPARWTPDNTSFTFYLHTNKRPGYVEPTWFQATQESTLSELKYTIQLKGGPEFYALFAGVQALWYGDVELEDGQMTLWVYGVRQGSQIDLWRRVNRDDL
jgi:hypothetical protein